MSIRRHFLYLDHHLLTVKLWDTNRHAAGDGAAEPEHLPGQHPPHQPDAVGALVVAGDGDVHELGGRVHVAEGDHGDVGVAALGDGLVVGPGVAHHQQPGLAEGGLDLIGEGSGGEASSDGAAVHIPAGRTTVNKYAWDH